MSSHSSLLYSPRQVIDDFRAVGITVFLALVKANVQKHLVRGGFYEKFDKEHAFLTIHDAVLAALRHQPTLLMELILDAPVFPITAIKNATAAFNSSGEFFRTRTFILGKFRFLCESPKLNNYRILKCSPFTFV